METKLYSEESHKTITRQHIHTLDQVFTRVRTPSPMIMTSHRQSPVTVADADGQAQPEGVLNIIIYINANKMTNT
ncbi:hypothetical protein T08_4857 [Trichinella sp. T8]|nr:hypothetical protein T08_4857 [Trichinella sp. T8]